MNLNSRDWKPFKLISDELFYLDDCRTLKTTSVANDSGVYDVVGATSKNNGNVGFIGDDYKDLLVDGNCICLIKTGEGSVGEAVYKNGTFIPSNNVAVIRSNYLNKYNAQFIVGEINKQSIRYSYGYIRNNKRINKEILMLPFKKEDPDQPDWEFMEQYVKYIMNLKKELYKKYISKQLVQIKYEHIPKLEDKEWKEFFLISLFPIVQRGKRLTKANQIEGNIPYVSSTALLNGVDNFISNTENVRIFEDCLTIANSGSVGSSFYQPFNFIASDHITHLKNNNMNKYIYLFIVTMTKRLSEKYNFNREINDERLSREKVMLPINDNGDPDFEYMEQYIKNMMFRKYRQYQQ